MEEEEEKRKNKTDVWLDKDSAFFSFSFPHLDTLHSNAAEALAPYSHFIVNHEIRFLYLLYAWVQ